MSLSENPSVPNPKQLLERYFTELLMANWSVNTVDRRRCSLGRLIGWLEQRDITCVTELTVKILEAYRRSLYHDRNAKTDKPLKFSTQASYLSAMKHWVEWLHQQQLIEADYGKCIPLPKEEYRLPASYLNLSEIDDVLNSVDVETVLGLRDRSMLETLYSTGMRRSELAKLRLDDVDRERRLIVLRQTKNRKDRVVPIGVRAMQWLEKYIQEVRPTFPERNNDQLYLTATGRPFHVNHLSKLVREYLDAAGVKKRGSCHMVRHTTATLMMEGGADLRTLQTLLGHANLNTTQIYTHVTIMRLREVHEKTHPAKPDELPKAPKTSASGDDGEKGEKPAPKS